MHVPVLFPRAHQNVSARGVRQQSARSSQVSRNFSIRRLRKSFVERPDREGPARGDQDNDIVERKSQLLGGLRTRDRRRQSDSPGAACSNTRHGGPGRRTSRDPIIHDNGCASSKVKESVLLPVSGGSTLQFELLERGFARVLLFGDVQRNTDRLLADRDAAFGERPHCEFELRWHAHLAHDDDVEWCAKNSCDFVGNDDATSRQAQDDHGVVVVARAEANTKLPPRVGSINEPLHVLGLPSRPLRNARRRHR
jgi:hypothetical protein